MVTALEFLCHYDSLITQEQSLDIEGTGELLRQYSPIHLQRLGLALVGTHITGWRTGLGGKTLVDLEPPTTAVDGVFPPHQLRAGDVVGLEASHAGQVTKGGRTPGRSRGGSAKASTSVGGATSTDGSGSLSGVVCRVKDNKLVISLPDSIPTEWNERCTVTKLANDVTFKRIHMALATLVQKSALITSQLGSVDPTQVPALTSLQTGKTYPGPITSETLTQVLLGELDPLFTIGQRSVPCKSLQSVNLDEISVDWFDLSLNASQRHAVQFALAAQHLALIHGPPGTGKTYTLVEIIRQLARVGEQRILVCGPSNISVDNLVERLAKYRLSLVRLGHPARILPAVVNHSLDMITKYSDQGLLLKDVRQDMDDTLAQIRKSKKRSERYELFKTLKELRKEFRTRESQVVDQCLKSSQVVLTTLNGAGVRQLDHHRFDVVIIDEATQALEGECWIAALKGSKLILAGDHLQLPPTVKSITHPPNLPSPERRTVSGTPSTKSTLDQPALDQTLFDRLLARYGPGLKRMLTVQYRMHHSIMQYSAAKLYQGELTAHPSVAEHKLTDLEGVADTDTTRVPLLMIDTAGCDYLEQTDGTQGNGDTSGLSNKNTQRQTNKKTDKVSNSLGRWLELDSKFNQGEAELVEKHLELLVEEGGLTPSQIAVISPYNAQVRLLTSQLKSRYPELEIGSVDGFQGREKEAIILSLVRSNAKGEVGFLADYRRLNVAITRPKRQLCIIGDSETLAKHDPFLRGLCQWSKNVGEEHCAEYY
ncbi:hypothetical protein IWQ62_003979 [Dispira parvispora]|uniref:DNA helicase n=1 Tax=Dispira parvispora TaxID=1520584 RepID=A0A9W8ANC6_9FUNG|nr:hypothetical protein IWQ62_003979 [Dispira parvispora]